MKHHLHIRIGVTVAMIALIVAVVTSFFSYRFTHSQTLNNAKQTLSQLLSTVQRTASIAVFLDNKEIADEVITGLSNNDFVQAVSLTSVTGFKVTHGTFSENNNRSDLVTLQLESPFNPGEKIGELTILPNIKVIGQKARKNALIGVVVLAGFILLVAFIITQVVQVMFIFPLGQVATSLNTVLPGGDVFIPAPDKHKEDEIGNLVKYINNLLGMVKQELDTERRLREEIQGLEKRFRMIFERAGIGIFLIDQQGRLIMANPSFKRLIGPDLYEKIELHKDNCLDRIFKDADSIAGMLKEAILKNTSVSSDLLLHTTDENDVRWVNCLFTRVLDESGEALLGETLMQGIINDITDRKLREQLISFQAEHDPLTQLLNRRAAEQKVIAALKKAGDGDYCVALFLIDLDKFKPVNDTYGHDAGDKVLVEVARRLLLNLRHADIAARLGGDEFLVATIGKSTRAGTTLVAGKLLQNLREDITLPEGVVVNIGASIGISLSTIHGTDLAELLVKADRAMYQVKMAGRNGFCIHE